MIQDAIGIYRPFVISLSKRSASTKTIVCSVTSLSAGSKRVSSQSRRRESALLVTLAAHLLPRLSAQ